MELSMERWQPQQDVSNPTQVILLHGMGGTGKLWRPIAASLEKRFRVIAPDQRGHGGSQNPPEGDYTPLDFGRDLATTLEKTGEHPTWVVGHSMGVRTALAFFHLKPQWVQGLVLIDLGFYGPAGGGLGDNLENFLSVLPPEFPNRAEAKAFMEARCPDASIGRYLMAVSQVSSSGKLVFPFDHKALIRTIRCAKDFDLRPWIEEAGKKNIPVWILRGGQSKVWTAEEFEKEKATFSSYPSLIFETMAGTGHGLPFEKRREFVEKLTTLMERS